MMGVCPNRFAEYQLSPTLSLASQAKHESQPSFFEPSLKQRSLTGQMTRRIVGYE